MQSTAKLRHLRIAPRKVRSVSDLVRGKGINEALTTLRFCTKRKIAGALSTLLESAVANADQQGKIDVDTLYVKTLLVDQGPTLKRYRPRAQGRAFPIQKKTSHITVVLEER